MMSESNSTTGADIKHSKKFDVTAELFQWLTDAETYCFHSSLICYSFQ